MKIHIRWIYIDGLVLLASYSTADLSASGLPVISIYGSEDGVLNREKYTEYKRNLPAALEEYIIEGGCHAGFGSHGPQDGDGVPTITGEEQIAETVRLLKAFFKSTQEWSLFTTFTGFTAEVFRR